MIKSKFYEHTGLPTSFGTPALTIIGRQRVFVWKRDKGGDAIVMARTASPSQRLSGEQIGKGRAALAAAELQVGAIVASVGIDGLGPPSDRPDLQQLEQLLETGSYSTVYWSSPDRIARSHPLIEEHWSWLDSRAIDLFMFDRRLDRDNELDHLMIQISAVMAFAELDRMRQLMLHGAAAKTAVATARKELRAIPSPTGCPEQVVTQLVEGEQGLAEVFSILDELAQLSDRRWDLHPHRDAIDESEELLG